MELDIPHDRRGEFEPQIIKKYQNTATQDMVENIISMYTKGMTTADTVSHMRELYDIKIPDGTINQIIVKIPACHERTAGKSLGRYLRSCFLECHPLLCEA